MLNVIQTALVETKVQADVLNPKEAEEFRSTLENRYAASRGSSPLWERLENSVAVCRKDGWAKACEFVGERESFLFFDQGECVDMWRFKSGDHLLRVLRECPAFEFYIADTDASFVLCHNHHDYLIGVGTCKPWLEEIGSEKRVRS